MSLAYDTSGFEQETLLYRLTKIELHPETTACISQPKPWHLFLGFSLLYCLFNDFISHRVYPQKAEVAIIVSLAIFTLLTSSILIALWRGTRPINSRRTRLIVTFCHLLGFILAAFILNFLSHQIF